MRKLFCICENKGVDNRAADQRLCFRYINMKYTMHNKFSNCFVWVSPSKSDLKFHFLALRYKRRSPDNNFHVNIYRFFNRSDCTNVTLDFETSVQSGYL